MAIFRRAGLLAWMAALTLFGSAPIRAAIPAVPSSSASEIERRINAMSANQKVAQLLLVSFDGTVSHSDLREMVGGWGVGGVVFSAVNIRSAAQIRRLTASIRGQSRNGILPFIAVDHEGGTVIRLHSGIDALPGNMALGATGSRELAYRAGAEAGTDLLSLGFTMNFAPVLDVYGNPASAIGTRSFGESPDLVAALGSAFIEGQSSARVISVAKHFVGTGEAGGDSHDGTPIVALTAAQMLATDFVPFRDAMAHGLQAVMTAHVAIPDLTSEGELPVTLSRVALTDYLRGALHFEGIVITDALEMTSLVSREHDFGELALEAIDAGADMVLVSGIADDRRKVFRRLTAAYRAGRISEERIRASLRRILTLKAAFGADEPPHPGIKQCEANRVASRIAEQSMTLIEDREGILPLFEDRRDRARAAYIGPGGLLAQSVGGRRAILPRKVEQNEVQAIADTSVAAIGSANVIIGAAENRRQAEILRRIAAARPSARFVAISLGNPHDLELLGRADVRIAAYSTAEASQRAVAGMLRGEIAPHGVLPVTLASSLSDIAGWPAVAHSTNLSEGEQSLQGTLSHVSNEHRPVPAIGR